MLHSPRTDLTRGLLAQGWTLAAQGHAKEGATHLRQGLMALQTVGAKFEQRRCVVFLAETYTRLGKRKEGLTLLEEALSDIDTTRQHLREAELYRLKGELLLQPTNRQAGTKVRKIN